MSTATKLAAYAGALVLVFAASVGLGRAVGPIGDPPSARHDRPPTTAPAPDGGHPPTTHAHTTAGR